MIIKFKTDGSVEKKGFRASWRTEDQTCGGNLIAGDYPGDVLESPNYGVSAYPGGLECLHIIKASNPNQIITLEILDMDFEPKRDFVLVRDGNKADSRILASLSNNLESNPR